LPSAAALAEARNLDKAWNLNLRGAHHDGCDAILLAMRWTALWASTE